MPDNKARTESRVMKAAAMDIALSPIQTICTELGINRQTLYSYRNTDLYRSTVEELRAAWKEAMLRTPGTAELRKEINYGLSIAVKKLIHILSLKKTPNRDLIGAARLMAQMDGRFIGHDAEEARARGGVDDSVASELINMVKRVRDTQPPTDKVQ
jgi:AcrR family transcriptional regulator